MKLAFVSTPWFQLDPLQKRRWENFKKNKRGFWSLRIFLALFGLSLIAEVIANDKPLLVSYDGAWLSPVFALYPETRFGGEFETEADYTDPAVQCLIKTTGLEDCLDFPEEILEELDDATGWLLWPLIPWHFDTINKAAPTLPAPPTWLADAEDRDAVERAPPNWLGTDDRGRDLVALTIYGFRLSVTFGLIVTGFAAVIGILAGAVQGYFGGVVDLAFQRFIEIWGAVPFLYIVMIMSSIFAPNFWVLTTIVAIFTWTAFVGVVRAEFLRARNFEYVQAARALGVGDYTIMLRHVLPNAMVATLTMLPFVLTGAISTLAILDFLGFGLTENYPSLGEIGLQAKTNLQAPWLGLTAFFTLSIMLSLLVFIFEAVRDAFDPRKTFQ